jgi:hypothetical protein
MSREEERKTRQRRIEELRSGHKTRVYCFFAFFFLIQIVFLICVLISIFALLCFRTQSLDAVKTTGCRELFPNSMLKPLFHGYR